MALLFSYGTLQEATVQLSTFGRRLSGRSAALPGFAPSSVPIADPEVSAATGKTHHANVTFNGDGNSQVAGTVFDVSEAELASADEFEAPFLYARVMVRLASGDDAWVYVYSGDGLEPGAP
jgi:hypothetical protein